ncbi:MAG: glutamine-synthetase adenylyltransferase [Bryobacterales bacterium]|nr:glutamine-synthetase adenylyltransferase [Bryobacterales bacterium]
MQERLRLLLSRSADPDNVLHYLRRLLEQKPAAFQRLAVSPALLQYLVAVFSQSQFLSEELLRTPEWIETVGSYGDLHRVVSADEYMERLERSLEAHGAGMPPAVEYARFRRRQLLRILVRDVLQFGTLSDITEEISNLADAIIESAYLRIRHELRARHGEPEDGALTILALGKLGGRELNYSSDIDLMFIYSNNGETTGPDRISNKEFFKKLCTKLTELLSGYTPFGFCYRVDLRLRPEGSLGDVCISMEGARDYYRKRARDWELQMLIKARAAAGDRSLGRQLLDFIEPLTYATSLDFTAIEAVSLARERISEKMARKRQAKPGLDVKLAPGGIRDIEFLVQCLQRLHGGREPWVRHGGTLLALFRLRDKGLLSETEYSRLAHAYQFLRNLEHRLQFADDLQTHILPDDAETTRLMALRMPAGQLGSEPSGKELRETLQRHLSQVQDIYERLIHAQIPAHYREPLASVSEIPKAEMDVLLQQLPGGPAAPSNLVRSLEMKASGLAATLSRLKLTYGLRSFEHFLEKVLPNQQWLNWLDEDPTLAAYVVDLFEHSPFFAEQLVRKPELLEELHRMRVKPESRTRYEEMPALLHDATDLRRFFRREMLRIQSESICLHAPVFDTLRRTSELAGCVIAAAYRLALEQVVNQYPPSQAGYAPGDQLMVMALGRLGMLEFDLASDADLVFVLPDEDQAEGQFWTRVATRMVEILTAYTGEGTLFAIDTRLRPNGREGPLVQTEGAYKDYFEKQAEAWEGITYMKARAIAGNLERGTRFLNGLQEVDWRRYGQGGRSKTKLRQMRQRLEQEIGVANPLKAGRGGYYDIDFALMYLRLKGAGIFFTVLNTPARIDIVEKMGHMDRADAQFLNDAAIFYRAVDHALRLSSGHAEGNLPSAPMQLQILTELVSRWTPDHLHDQPLPDELDQIQRRTREYFDRLFAA